MPDTTRDLNVGRIVAVIPGPPTVLQVMNLVTRHIHAYRVIEVEHHEATVQLTGTGNGDKP